MENKQRGFIGAIGDDLPSLVPIFFALLIFFSILSYAFITISDRNDYLERYFNSISISKEILGESNYYGLEDFKNRTKNITSAESYAAGLTNDLSSLSGDNYLDYGDFIYKKPDMNNVYCLKGGVATDGEGCDNGQDEDNSFYVTNVLDDEIKLDQVQKMHNPFTYTYPVALYTNKGTMDLYLYVLVW